MVIINGYLLLLYLYIELSILLIKERVMLQKKIISQHFYRWLMWLLDSKSLEQLANHEHKHI